MTKQIIILGSTGSIGRSALNVIRKNDKKFNIKLLSTNSNINKIYNQALEFKVKNVLIINEQKFDNFKKKFKKKKIKVFFNIDDALKNISKKVFCSINGISGIAGLEPTLKIIKYSGQMFFQRMSEIVNNRLTFNVKVIKRLGL